MAKARRSPTRPTLTPVEFARSQSGREIAAKLEWLMLFRVLMVTVLLGAAILSSADTVASLSQPFHLFLYGIIIVTYGLTLGYAVAVRRVRDVRRFALIQLAGDVIVSACLVHMTGGTESVFTFLFSLSIINGSILLYRPGALAVATFCSAAFLVIGAHEASWIQLPQLGPRPVRVNLYYVTFIHLTTFYLVAILASYLAEQLRRAGKEIEEKTLNIAELRALNDNIVRSLSSGLVTIDHGGRIISCNEGAAQITGHSREDVLMKPVSQVFKELADVLTFSDDEPGVQSTRLETSFTRQDNNARIIVQYTVSPLRGHDGEVYGKVVHFEDATQIHALESAVKRHERLAAVGELAAAIAHEIRNPLASISGSVEMLGSMDGGSEAQGRLQDIVLRETERLNMLITDFLRYARPRPPDPVSTDLGNVVRETVEAFLQEVADGDAAVEVEIEDAGDAWASADGGQVRQVIWNLLHNAADAMPEGGRVTVSMERRATDEEDEAEDLWIHLQDEGPGVARAIRDRIFEPFYTTRKEGTGLGLAISQRIMEDHDGDLILECPRSGGSIFSMRLRATAPLADEAAA